LEEAEEPLKGKDFEFVFLFFTQSFVAIEWLVFLFQIRVYSRPPKVLICVHLRKSAANSVVAPLVRVSAAPPVDVAWIYGRFSLKHQLSLSHFAARQAHFALCFWILPKYDGDQSSWLSGQSVKPVSTRKQPNLGRSGR